LNSMDCRVSRPFGFLISMAAAVTLAACSSAPLPLLGAGTIDGGGAPSSACIVDGPGIEALVAIDGGAACPCQGAGCSVTFAGGHVGEVLDLASDAIEYVLDAGILSACGAHQISECVWAGSCTGGIASPAVLSTSFSYTLEDGGAVGTQTVVFAAPDGGAGSSCSFQVAFAPL
jgi:hypothetical protein